MLTQGTRIPNTLLSHLPQWELETVAPRLTREWLPADTVLVGIDEQPQCVWFPESAIVSVAVSGGYERDCCVGIYGYEGCGSAAAILGAPTSPSEERVQRAGWAHRIKSCDLHLLLSALPALRRILHSYIHIFMIQVSYAALAANARVERRLARVLLMIQDRARENAMAITHQRLSDMMNVRRAGITDAVHMLEGEKLVRAQRGLIQIFDRPSLMAFAGALYGKPEAEYNRLILETMPSGD